MNNNNHSPQYKRGTFMKDGKMYGRYPDGTPYRIYTNTENCRQFLVLVDENGATVLHVRQTTEQGYAVVPPWGVCDLAYPTSQLRRARTVGGGRLVNALTCGAQFGVFVEWD